MLLVWIGSASIVILLLSYILWRSFRKPLLLLCDVLLAIRQSAQWKRCARQNPGGFPSFVLESPLGIITYVCSMDKNGPCEYIECVFYNRRGTITFEFSNGVALRYLHTGEEFGPMCPAFQASAQEHLLPEVRKLVA